MFTKLKERQRHFDSLWCQRKGRIQSVRKSEFSVPRSPCFSRAPEEYSNLCFFNGAFATYLLLKDPLLQTMFHQFILIFLYFSNYVYSITLYIVLHLETNLKISSPQKHDSPKKHHKLFQVFSSRARRKAFVSWGRTGFFLDDFFDRLPKVRKVILRGWELGNVAFFLRGKL